MLMNFLLVAFFAVLTAIGGMISIPTPFFVPFTLQTLVVLMSGLLLGPKYGPLSQALYIAMGLIGLPVFAGGAGGVHYVFMPTFGFLVGFVAVSWIAGLLGPRARSLPQYILVSLAAAICLYLVALPLFYVNMNYVAGTKMSFIRAAQLAFLPFAVPDALKAVAAAWLAAQSVPVLQAAGLYRARKSPSRTQCH